MAITPKLAEMLPRRNAVGGVCFFWRGETTETNDAIANLDLGQIFPRAATENSPLEAGQTAFLQSLVRTVLSLRGDPKVAPRIIRRIVVSMVNAYRVFALHHLPNHSVVIQSLAIYRDHQASVFVTLPGFFARHFCVPRSGCVIADEMRSRSRPPVQGAAFRIVIKTIPQIIGGWQWHQLHEGRLG